jgi:hypothetical protein
MKRFSVGQKWVNEDAMYGRFFGEVIGQGQVVNLVGLPARDGGGEDGVTAFTRYGTSACSRSSPTNEPQLRRPKDDI